MRGLRWAAGAEIYLILLVGAVGWGKLPTASGRPCLIHCMVKPTGRDPTSKGGLKLRYGLVASPSDPGGKSTTKLSPCAPLTGLDPIPSPAAVKAFPSAIAAILNFANCCRASSLGSHALYDDGEKTLSPSDKCNECPVRLSSIISGSHPFLDRTIAISFARFWASASPGITWIKTLIPAHLSNPTNHFIAGGGWSIPISPTWRGNNTVCSARLSACSRAVSLFSFAADSLALAASEFASASSFAASALYRFNSNSDATASLLCETIEPVVVTPIAVAATAANTTDTINQKSHHSPLWPRNRLEAAAFALLIASVMGGGRVDVFCIIALRTFRKSPGNQISSNVPPSNSSAAIQAIKNVAENVPRFSLIVILASVSNLKPCFLSRFASSARAFAP